MKSPSDVFGTNALVGDFVPIEAIFGGITLGSVVFFLFFYNGKVLGYSGILGQVLSFEPGVAWYRVVFLVGLFVGSRIVYATYPEGFETTINAAPYIYVISGLLIGFGTQMGNGCTSGHMLCGVSRLSKRSIFASAVFVSVAILVANTVSARSYYPDPERGVSPFSSPSPQVIGAMAGTVTVLFALYFLIALFSGALVPSLNLLPKKISIALVAFLSGAGGAFGLTYGGMTKQSAVLGFLSVSSVWNPTLLIFFIPALAPNLILYFTYLRPRGKPLIADIFDLPLKKKIDWELLTGAVLFGLGWGVSGYCPGPNFVVASTFEPNALWLLLGTVSGMVAYRWPKLWWSTHRSDKAEYASVSSGSPSSTPLRTGNQRDDGLKQTGRSEELAPKDSVVKVVFVHEK